jgi:leader peptidase (prepilin peptidase)/N-methyltransferase
VTDTLFYIFVFVVGACIGSFLNVCVGRWPAGLSVVRPRSRCPGCGHEITWYENIPIVSWLALRARCSGCGVRISPQYPLVELIVGLGWLAAVLHFGPTLTALRVAIFGTILLGVMLTDAQAFEIPDGFTVTGFVLAIGFAIAAVVVDEPSPFASLPGALVGACVGAGAISIAMWLGEAVFKREAMGFGDVTLMAMVGAHVGTVRALVTVFLGALLGAVLALPLLLPGWLAARSRGATFASPEIPFGVFLVPAAFIALLWWPELARLYIAAMTSLLG